MVLINIWLKYLLEREKRDRIYYLCLQKLLRCALFHLIRNKSGRNGLMRHFGAELFADTLIVEWSRHEGQLRHDALTSSGVL